MALSFLLRPASLHGMQLFDEQYIQSAHVLPVIVVGKGRPICLRPLEWSSFVIIGLQEHTSYEVVLYTYCDTLLYKKNRRCGKCCAAVHVVTRVHMYSMAY